MEVTGEVVQVVETPRLPARVCQVAEVVPQPVPTLGVSGSAGGQNGFSEEQKEMGGEVPRRVERNDFQRNEANAPRTLYSGSARLGDIAARWHVPAMPPPAPAVTEISSAAPWSGALR